jgi:peptide/nickel transport system substrate-binding protein
LRTISSFLITVAFVAGMVGCTPGPTQYDLTVSITEGGEVVTPSEGTFTYGEGTVVTLIVFPHTGYRFVNWTGDVDTVADVYAPSTTITMNDNYSITANFASDSVVPLKNPGSFVQMTTGDIDSFDPAWGYDTASAEQVEYIYETLLFYDRDKTDQFLPILATEWEFDSENLTYRFKIREGVKFHEGGDLTPEDVEYSFQRAMVQDREGGPVWMLYQALLGLHGSRDADGNIQVAFQQIDNAVEVDGNWVVFHQVYPASTLAFLQILCGTWASIVDKEWCIANGGWDGTEETWQDYNNADKAHSYLYNHTNGTGPWKLEQWDPGIQIKLVRNDDYWREPAAFEMVITEFVSDWTARKAALLAGDVDSVCVPRADIGELEGIPDLSVYRDLPELAIEALFFNLDITSDSEFIGSGELDGEGIPTDFFTDIDVRKGFSYAFDWTAHINDVYMGEAEQRGSPIIKGLPYYNPDASMYSHDLTKAEEHLKLAWEGKVWDRGFNFTLPYSAGSVPRGTACKILADNLAAINPKFQVSIQPMNWATDILEDIEGGLLPIFQLGWTPDYPHPDNLVVPFMASYGLVAQFQSYGYPELDELIEDACREVDPAVQQDMYYEIQERYYQDAPGIMLVQVLGRRYFTKYIEGFYHNPWVGTYGPLPLYYMSKSSP